MWISRAAKTLDVNPRDASKTASSQESVEQVGVVGGSRYSHDGARSPLIGAAHVNGADAVMG